MIITDSISKYRYDFKLFEVKPLKVQIELLNDVINKSSKKVEKLRRLKADTDIDTSMAMAKAIKRFNKRKGKLINLRTLLITQALEEQEYLLNTSCLSFKQQYRYLARFKITLSTDIGKIKGYDLLCKIGYYNKTTNPNGCVLDHRISIKYGINNNIPPKILGNLANCEFLSYRDNLLKSSKCSITYEQLLQEINSW